jgi:FtsZ-interacting cell division protein YlmF
MSEYQFYEFQAIDRFLSEKDREALRDISTRAHITSTGFTNEYNWGNFKGDPLKLMEKYFDAFLYVSNWGTHWFMLRIPRKLINLNLARQYCIGDSVVIHEKKDSLIFEFTSETEDYEWEEGEGYLSSMILLRSDLIHGDYRCLHLAWLFCVQMEEIEEEAEEPPVPSNLGNLSASLESFSSFMRIDPDLIAVAVKNSIAEQKPVKDDKQLKSWINKLSLNEKEALLFRLIRDNDPHIGNELRQRFKKEASDKGTKKQKMSSHTVLELLQKANTYSKERQQREAIRKAKEKARKEKEAAIARENYLNDIAKRENNIWEKIDSLILTKKPKAYDEAVLLLADLRDLGKKNNTIKIFKSKLMGIREKHSRKPSLISRIKSAHL